MDQQQQRDPADEAANRAVMREAEDQAEETREEQLYREHRESVGMNGDRGMSLAGPPSVVVEGDFEMPEPGTNPYLAMYDETRPPSAELDRALTEGLNAAVETPGAGIVFPSGAHLFGLAKACLYAVSNAEFREDAATLAAVERMGRQISQGLASIPTAPEVAPVGLYLLAGWELYDQGTRFGFEPPRDRVPPKRKAPRTLDVVLGDLADTLSVMGEHVRVYANEAKDFTEMSGGMLRSVGPDGMRRLLEVVTRREPEPEPPLAAQVAAEQRVDMTATQPIGPLP